MAALVPGDKRLPEEAHKGVWCAIKKLQLEEISLAFPRGLSVTSARFRGQECVWQLHKSEITGDIAMLKLRNEIFDLGLNANHHI